MIRNFSPADNKGIIAGIAVGSFLAAKWLLRKTNEITLKDKVVLITGGSRGLGLVLGRELAIEGAKLAICARSQDELEAAKNDLKYQGATEVFTTVCDVTDKSQVDRIVNEVITHFGQIDILINNAGVIRVSPFEDSNLKDYRDMMDILYWGPLYSTMAVFPEMKRKKEGRIINISSIGGKISIPHLVAYSAGKFALAGLSEGLRAEFSRFGIKVTTVFPGLMRTGSHPNADFKGQNKKEYGWFSIFDTLPLVSVSAEYAARKIVKAIKTGQAELVFPNYTRLVTVLHSMVPGFSSSVMTLFNKLLPEANSNKEISKGWESFSEVSPSTATSLGDKATLKNNQY